MNTVQIMPNKDGQLVTPYSGNSEFGYIQLAQTGYDYKDGWLRKQPNRTIIKGSVKSLKSFVDGNPSLQLPGNLVVKEYREDEVPPAVAKANFDEKLSFEEQISNYVKRAGKDGPIVTVEGKRILRFTTWDMSGTQVNITVQHDNQDVISAYNNAVSQNAAELPN